jgi:hypothetical protein
MKQKWLKVIQNKHSLQLKDQIRLKFKFDRLSKQDKDRKKRQTENIEEAKMLQEHMHEKLGLVAKRRDTLRVEFE